MLHSQNFNRLDKNPSIDSGFVISTFVSSKRYWVLEGDITGLVLQLEIISSTCNIAHEKRFDFILLNESSRICNMRSQHYAA